MELKPGYKQTEVGVIPENWNVVLLDSVSRRASGHTPDKAHHEYWGGDIKWVSLADSHRLDNLYIHETTATITAKGIANSSANILPAGSCIVSRDAGVGKSAILAEDMAVSQHFMAWHCGPRLDNHYLYFLLQAMKPELERIAIGNTIKTIGLPYFRNLRIPLPSIEEQQAIATALLEVDQLIRELVTSIAKKRGIKQAAMQELLSGKRRLPGFEGEWETKSIGSHIDLLTGYPFPSQQYCSSGVRLLRGSNVKRGLTDWSHELVQHWPSLTPEVAPYLLREGDLVIAMDGSLVGRSYARLTSSDLPALLLQRVARIRSTTLDIGFLTQFVGSKEFISHCDAVKTVTAIPHISPADIRSFKISIPPDINEQAAISNLLSEIDAEIDALEHRINKTRAFKQAMMRELLTGRIRLR